MCSLKFKLMLCCRTTNESCCPKYVLSVCDVRLPCNVPVLWMGSWDIVKLRTSLFPFPPASPSEKQVWMEVSEMLSGFSAPVEGRHFYKTCRELKVWCLREVGGKNVSFGRLWMLIRRESSCLYCHSLYQLEYNPRKWETQIYYLQIALTCKF